MSNRGNCMSYTIRHVELITQETILREAWERRRFIRLHRAADSKALPLTRTIRSLWQPTRELYGLYFHKYSIRPCFNAVVLELNQHTDV